VSSFVRSWIVVVALLCSLVWLRPLVAGTWPQEPVTAPDEAAHYVTGLMIRAYVDEGLGENPRAFAERYYVSYPKVAFGIWPPLFHILLGAWLWVFGPSFSAAVAMSASITVALAFILCWSTRKDLGLALALAAAVWFASFPDVQASTRSVMLDLPCALLMIGATVPLGRYLDATRTRDAVLFALLAAGAFLTKYNGVAMAFVPLLAVAASRKWHVLKRPNFWLIPVVVLVVAGPWYWAQREMVQYASEPVPERHLVGAAAVANLKIITNQAGALILPFIMAGIYGRVVRPGSAALWSALLAVGVAVWLFHSIVYPVTSPRYLIASYAVWAIFAAAGARWFVDKLIAIEWRRGVPAQLTAFGAVAVAAIAWSLPAPPARHFADITGRVLQLGLHPTSTALVSSDPIGEGAFIAAMAARDLHPRPTVLRATKTLAEGTWMGLHYAERFQDERALAEWLDRARVDYVVVDDASSEPHHRRLDTFVRHSAVWRLEPTIRRTERWPIRLYHRVEPLPPGVPDFEIDMGYTIGKTLGPS
jgi:hypothetical protein